MLCDKLYRVRFDPGVCLPTFAAKFLGTKMARGRIEVEATGASSSMQNIGQGTILEMSIPVPPIDEQRKIVSFLDREISEIASFIDASRRAIDLLKERRSALISAAITGKIDVRGLATSGPERGVLVSA
jgi:type I restriction enzyme S subunit